MQERKRSTLESKQARSHAQLPQMLEQQRPAVTKVEVMESETARSNANHLINFQRWRMIPPVKGTTPMRQ